ncbi:MAG TPA: VRR-NUC domain-containing protein [Noviherbaspirillum sp.]|nr:VRR-NUC domain-containing protein [Noviherbaspirillum sp.]
MIRTLENRFYYLDNFHRVVEWIRERYSDLLTAEELAFIDRFGALPQPSRALLVRMVMRKGELFRSSKLSYEEIGCTQEAARPLAELGWIDDRPLLTLEQLFGLLTKTEIVSLFRASLPSTQAKKEDLLESLLPEFADARHFHIWHPEAAECVYQVHINPLCDRLQLLFFGNCRQDWSEFVLSDLGIYKYEKVEFSASSRGFRTREDVDSYLHLHQCRERFEQGELLDEIMKDIPTTPLANDWLEGRRAKLLFQVAQQYERCGEFDTALGIYTACTYPEARVRAIRVMERSEQFEPAFALAQAALEAPENETERQQLLRILPRLHRKLGLPKIPAQAETPVPRLDLLLPQPDTDYYVEEVAARHLAQSDAPVYYVENTLITSLFGLLCWKAIFAAVPGAFFHPFHIGPADLHSPDFQRRREQEFADCLSQLDTGQYIDTINRNFTDKMGTQSPFVAWQVLDEELKDLALQCIPAAHLKKWFARILQDIAANRAGLPDLIQFWPAERRYRMIEVKGPGDRLQDNQIRWLDYCIAHGMPVSVCHVQWAEASA